METIPILDLGDLLLVTIQVDMHDRLALTFQQNLAQRIVSSRARGVVLDISALDTLDTFIGRILGDIASMSRILGAQLVLVGMRPAVAMTLVELGMALEGVDTAVDVNRAMARLRRREDP